MSKYQPAIENWKIQAQAAAKHLRNFPTKQKNEYLKALAKKLLGTEKEILAANDIDVKQATEAHSAFVDRLTLNPERLKQMAESLTQVADLNDPVGEELENRILPNALRLRKVRSPLGVIFMIFESRPNVITEAFSLAFKSGNAILLRGGSESAKTAAVIYRLMHETAKDLKMEFSPFVAIDVYDRELVTELLTRKDFIDVVVPRGGDRLIEFVNDNATMPIIKNDRGMCHCYVDEAADLAMVTPIVINAKTQRPGVCNSLETLLLHKSIAAAILPKIFEASSNAGLEWRLDNESANILGHQPRTKAASTKDWDTEHLAQILNCRVVNSAEEALEHIAKHGSKHSEAIITKNETLARRFQSEVDAAAVYWNASTRFTDGFEFGLGGELGISTQKLHVRGPVGLRELTSARWLIDGSGQIRS